MTNQFCFDWRLGSIVLLVWCNVTLSAFGVTVDITLDTNPPPTTTELTNFLPTVPGIPVGFNGEDIGPGSGNGIDEKVGFSFAFNAPDTITSAILTLTITKGIIENSDHLLFADNLSVFLPTAQNKYYGNDLLSNVQPIDGQVDVTFDLFNMGTNVGFNGVFGTEDLSNLLLDGDLNVVYFDDALIHSARLIINGTAVPEPSSIGMLCLVGAGLTHVLMRRRQMV